MRGAGPNLFVSTKFPPLSTGIHLVFHKVLNNILELNPVTEDFWDEYL